MVAAPPAARIKNQRLINNEDRDNIFLLLNACITFFRDLDMELIADFELAVTLVSRVKRLFP